MPHYAKAAWPAPITEAEVEAVAAQNHQIAGGLNQDMYSSKWPDIVKSYSSFAFNLDVRPVEPV